MKRKILSVFTVLIILSLLTTGLAMAGQAKIWVPVFNASDYGYLADHITWAVETYDDYLYAGVTGFQGAQIFRSPDGETWEAASLPSFGFDNWGYPVYWVIWDMHVFDGALYVAANDGGYFGMPGAVLRTFNGTDWERILDPGPALGGSLVDKLGSFKDDVYVAVVASNSDDSQSQIWRSANGNPGTWEMVAALGNDVWSLSSPTAFEGNFYISGFSDARGLLLWRSKDGTVWETIDLSTVVTPEVYMDGNLVAFKGKLYLSAFDGVNGGHIYRSEDGVTWQSVVQGGFESNFDSEITGMIIYQGDLYAPVWNGECFCMKLYASKTGDMGSWYAVGMDGWPEDYSSVIRNSQAVFKDDLYIANAVFYGDLYRLLHP